MITKYCSTCGETKDINLFSRKKASKDGHSTKCKSCHNKYMKEVWYINNKERHIKSQREYKRNNNVKVKSRIYGIEEGLLKEAITNAKGKCAICGKNSKLVIDHNHKNGKFRGLLCSSCNSGLGYFKDCIETMYSAINYIKNTE